MLGPDPWATEETKSIKHGVYLQGQISCSKQQGRNAMAIISLVA